MNAEECIKAGQLDEALVCAQDGVRKAPAQARPRLLLFQLFCVLGQWERAFTQLNVLKDMDANCMLLAHVFRNRRYNARRCAKRFSPGNAVP